MSRKQREGIFLVAAVERLGNHHGDAPCRHCGLTYNQGATCCRGLAHCPRCGEPANPPLNASERNPHR